MSGTFWCDLVANIVGGLVAGLVIVWVAEKTFGLRKERKRRRQERDREVERALKYIGLLRGEVEGISKDIPKYQDGLMESPRGMEVPLTTPVWDVVERSGELAMLLEPEVLTQTAYFYESLGYAKELLGWLMLSWYVPEEGVQYLEDKREQCRNTVVMYLGVAKKLGEKLLDGYDQEKRRLGTAAA